VARDSLMLGGEYETTAVIDQDDYPLPDAFFPPLRSVEWAHDRSDEKELPFVDDSWTAYYNRQSSGTPEAFTAIFNGRYLVVRLFPAPDTTYNLNIRCATLPDVMTADSSTCDLPTVAHDAIVEWGAYRAFVNWEEFTLAQMAKAQYDVLARDLLRAWQSPSRSYPMAGSPVGPPIALSQLPKVYRGM